MMSPRKLGAEGTRPSASTGPRSAAGKARSSMNALKSGIYSTSLTIPGEDPAKLTTLTEEYFERYRPALPEQRDLVDILVRSTWTLRRLAAVEAQVWNYRLDDPDPGAPLGRAFNGCQRSLERLQRIVNANQRNFRHALRELERLQALDAAPEPPPKPGPTLVPGPQPLEPKPVNLSKEFVSSIPVPPPPAAPKTAAKAPQKPLPFHQPGSHCDFIPVDPTLFQRCPVCFPEDCHPAAQE